MKLRLLYIDAVYPVEWLQEKRVGQDTGRMDFETYRQWIIEQRIYLSDYLTRNLEPFGFECETLIVNDPLFIKKLGGFLRNRNTGESWARKQGNRLREMADISPLKLYRQLKPSEQAIRDRVVKRACEYYRPDIIFVREPTGIDTSFWNSYRHRCLVAGLIGCNTAHPTNWLSHNFDVLYSLTSEYQQFFKVQGIPSYLFSYGTDRSVFDQVSRVTDKKYDVSFVGLLDSSVQKAKTNLMEAIAAKFAFSWWGPRNVDKLRFPNLHDAYQGRISGIEMLLVYRQSKIVVNDYVDTANGVGVNLRLYEVLNTGSFLLTRYAANLDNRFPDGLLNMYESEADCLSKIEWFLENEEAREKQAAGAARYALDHFSYQLQLEAVAETLRRHYTDKFRIQSDAGSAR